MTKQVFEQQITLLTRNFGTAEYTKDRIALIWSICSDLPDDGFKTIIRFFLETKSVKYPPVPSEFREQAVIIKKSIIKKIEPQKQLEHGQRSESTSKLVTEFLHKLGKVPGLTKEQK